MLRRLTLRRQTVQECQFTAETFKEDFTGNCKSVSYYLSNAERHLHQKIINRKKPKRKHLRGLLNLNQLLLTFTKDLEANSSGLWFNELVCDQQRGHEVILKLLTSLVRVPERRGKRAIERDGSEQEVCARCLLLISNNRLGLNCLAAYEHGYQILLEALDKGRQGTVRLVADLLKRYCKLSNNSHSRLVSHLDSYKRERGYESKFSVITRHLTLRVEDFTFTSSLLELLTAAVHSATSLNLRTFYQQEVELEINIENVIQGVPTSASSLHRAMREWRDNCIDIPVITRKLETAQATSGLLKDECRVLKDRLNEKERMARELARQKEMLIGSHDSATNEVTGMRHRLEEMQKELIREKVKVQRLETSLTSTQPQVNISSLVSTPNHRRTSVLGRSRVIPEARRRNTNRTRRNEGRMHGSSSESEPEQPVVVKPREGRGDPGTVKTKEGRGDTGTLKRESGCSVRTSSISSNTGSLGGQITGPFGAPGGNTGAHGEETRVRSRSRSQDPPPLHPRRSLEPGPSAPAPPPQTYTSSPGIPEGELHEEIPPLPDKQATLRRHSSLAPPPPPACPGPRPPPNVPGVSGVPGMYIVPEGIPPPPPPPPPLAPVFGVHIPRSVRRDDAEPEGKTINISVKTSWNKSSKPLALSAPPAPAVSHSVLKPPAAPAPAPSPPKAPTAPPPPSSIPVAPKAPAAPRAPGAPAPPRAPGAPAPPRAPGAPGLMQSTATLSRQPQVKLPLLHWNPVRHSPGTYWNDVNMSTVLDKLDLGKFEEQFKMKTRATASGVARIIKKKVESLCLLEQNRARSAMIIQRRVALPADRVVKSVENTDLGDLPLWAVELLHGCVPTREESELLKGNSEKLQEYGEAEQFCFQLTKVTRYDRKLGIMQFIGTFDEQFSRLSGQVKSVQDASVSIATSARLKKVLEIILALGNFMNCGRKGVAAGFKIQSLAKTWETHSGDYKTTLLHYIVRTIHTSLPELAGFTLEFPHLEDAQRVSLKDLVDDVQEMRKGLDTVLDERDKQRDNFVIFSFYSRAQRKVKRLCEQTRHMLESYEGVCKAFGENHKRIELHEFFKCFSDFFLQFDKIEKELCNSK